MSEHGEGAAIEREELRDIPKLLSRDRQLHAAARVRPDRAQVEVADRHAEPLLGGGGKLTRELDVIGVVIDVGVEIAD
jgi:hypothetical protein